MNLISQKKRSISVAPTTSRLTRSTTVTLPTRSSPTRETVLTPIHAHALSRTLPHPAVQHGPSSMNLNQPLSCHAIRRHLGCQKVLGVGAGHLPRVSDDRPTRGACRQIKTSRIVRMTQEKIRVSYNSVSRRATVAGVHSLLVHDIGAIVWSHCSMNMGYWRTISASERKDLRDEITICKTPENALANPPLEMLERGVQHSVELCNHLRSEKFMKASSANIANRAMNKHHHRTGVKLGRQIRGLGNGLLRDIGESSSNVRHMEKELEAERAAQKAADAALMKTEQRMQKKLKVVGQKFNATLQS
ncbi:hypothetical protein Q3G72_026713 [Acer saccharum]|nr:hypothetical protein Q3G72_026713 [Acer saccharum]